MANVTISNPDDESKQPKKQSRTPNNKGKKKYEEALTYELSFLKKKEAYEKSARAHKHAEEMASLKERFMAEIAGHVKLLGNTEAAEKAIQQTKEAYIEIIRKKQLEIYSDKRAAEYDAHKFAVECSMKALGTQTVHERAKTTAAIAEAQKQQAAKLREIKEAEILELQSQHKVAASRSDKIKITKQIRAIQQEIADAEAETVKYQAEASRYAEIVKKVDYERLSATEKLAIKQKEIADLQTEADNAIKEIDSAIDEKERDIAAANELGDQSLSEQLQKQLEELKTAREQTASEYEASVDQLKQTVEGKGGLKEQAEKESPPTAVTPIQPRSSEDESTSDITSKLNEIINCLDDLASVFKLYVDTLESRVMSDETISKILQSTTMNAGKGTGNNPPVAEHLKSLVEQSDMNDAKLQAELSSVLEKLSVDIESGSDSKTSNSLDAKTIVDHLRDVIAKNSSDVTTMKAEFMAGFQVLSDILSESEGESDLKKELSAGLTEVAVKLSPSKGIRDTSEDKDSQSLSEWLRALSNQSNIQDPEALSDLSAKLDMLAKIEASEGDNGDFTKDISSIIRDVTKAMEDFFGAETKKQASKKDSTEEPDVADKEDEDDSDVKWDYEEFLEKEKAKSPKQRGYELYMGNPDARPDSAAFKGMLQEAKEASREKTVESFADQARWARALTADGAKEELARGLQKLADQLEDFTKKIDQDINNYYKNQAAVNARLQGVVGDGVKTYGEMIRTMTGNIGMSAIISQEEFINNFTELVKSGISYNLESRTLLETVSDRVINTFEVINQDLQRLIRLQQADTTAARMGLESNLNKLFNSLYSDTTYLNDTHDLISSAILEASSMLSRDMALEFEYTVHKWLGSLYSLGMSDKTLQKIAEGLNYLGTGNVSALNGNDTLQTLLAMSSNYGGISYADILTQGLNAENTNKLLNGMITYLKAIAENTDANQVTKSAYTDVFGLEMSDFRALMNISEEDKAGLLKLNLNYDGALKEVQEDIDGIFSRTHMSQMIDTLFENATLGAALNIGSVAPLYGLWKVLGVVEGLTGGIALPFINVFGSGFDLNTTVIGLMKTGIAGLSMMGNLLGSLGGGGLDGRLDLINNWDLKHYTTRGDVSKFLTTGTTSGFSTSTRLDYEGSSSGSDMKRTEMSDATDSAEEDSKITNKNVEDAQEIPEKIHETTTKIHAALEDKDMTLLRQSKLTYQLLQDKLSSLDSLSSLLGEDRIFLTSSQSGFRYLNEFYTELVENQEGVFEQLTAQQYYSSKMQNITSSMVSAMQQIDDVSSLSFNLSTISNLMDSITEKDNKGNSVNDATDIVKNLYALTDTDDTVVNSELTSVQTFIEQLQNNMTTQQSEDLKTIAQIQALNKVVFPEYVNATIDNYSPDAQKFLRLLMQSAVTMSLNGGVDVNSGEEQIPPMIDILVKQFRTMLNGDVTVSTNCTNLDSLTTMP